MKLKFWTITLLFVVYVRLGLGFNLTLIHTNDVHSHFIEFNTHGGRCVDKLKEQKQCYGGFARQVTKIKEIRSNRDNVLFLNGGDFFQGTVWYTLHRWQIVAELVNTLTIDAMSLGNHEFDDGLTGLFPYLKNLKSKVVVCNIDHSRVPEFGDYVTPSTIVEVAGEKIGVIGYLTPETKTLSSIGDLVMGDEVECIKREAKRLATEEGLTKIMAVGHSGIAVDQRIAEEVPEIDIVVGGHTNTFLYTGEAPSVEKPEGPYPYVVERSDGSRALVVQDFAFGKYLGYLDVEFDGEGRVVSWRGNPILLDASVTEDEEILELLRPYGEEVKRRSRQTVGHTNVLLKGDRMTCRMKECNMGNFLADASLDYFIGKPTEKGWNFVAVALWNSGGIRGSIDERMNEGNITFEDILTVLPFGNTMDVVAIKGKYIKKLLEASVSDYDLDSVDPPGSFLQVSGLRLTYNVSNPIGSRLVESYVRCSECRVPAYRPLEDEEVYWVVMNTYMAKGGDGFALVQENAIDNRNTDELDIDIIMKYTRKNDPITTGLEDRIIVLSSRDPVTKSQRSATIAPKSLKNNLNQDKVATILSNISASLNKLDSDLDGFHDNSTGDKTIEDKSAEDLKPDRITYQPNSTDFQSALSKIQLELKEIDDIIRGEDMDKNLQDQFENDFSNIDLRLKNLKDKLSGNEPIHERTKELFQNSLNDTQATLKSTRAKFTPGGDENTDIKDRVEESFGKDLKKSEDLKDAEPTTSVKPDGSTKDIVAGDDLSPDDLPDVGVGDNVVDELIDKADDRAHGRHSAFKDIGKKLTRDGGVGEKIVDRIDSGIHKVHTGMKNVGEKVNTGFKKLGVGIEETVSKFPIFNKRR